MLETTGSIFDCKADALCCPTNGVVKANGCLVMGKGLAKAFAQRYPALPQHFGSLVEENGNHAYVYEPEGIGPQKDIVSFPTKHHWSQPADLRLIERSARRVKEWASAYGWAQIALPRVGCGLGQLDWHTQVQPLLSQILDDRFLVVHPSTLR
jgi:hypothetical protein